MKWHIDQRSTNEKTHVTSEWKYSDADANEHSSRPTPNRSLSAAAFSGDNFFNANASAPVRE
jgi:hypothetical protein